MPTDSNLIFTLDVHSTLTEVIDRISPSGIFVCADSNTARLIAEPLIESVSALVDARLIEIPAGDENKTLQSLAFIWETLSGSGANRNTLLINVGGGMITDIGGFAASTFKRGIRYVNLPTSLLAAVDASLGGKTGINFAGLKNEVGVFSHADAVIVSASYFASLPHAELLSGYAELLKHALLDSPQALADALAFDLAAPDYERLHLLLRDSIAVKQRVVEKDPFEQGLRKALNLGHTVAHALESLAMERNKPIPHGHAVAVGLIVDMVLSNLVYDFPSDVISQVATYVKEYYPACSISCDDYPALIGFMRHDKKNRDSSEINFTLLRSVGDPTVNISVTPDQITASLDIARDLLGL